MVIIAPVCILVGLWLPGVHQGFPRTDTEVYAALGLHAFEDGVWWRPSAGDTPYFNKPPLAIWVHGLALSVFAPDEGIPPMWLIRLPTLLAAICALAFAIDATRRLAGLRSALLTGLVLATTIEFFRYTKAISLDMWVCLWCMAAVWCVVRAVSGGTGLRPVSHSSRAPTTGRRADRPQDRSETGPTRGWIILAGVPIGLALITKPVLAFMPWGVLGAWLVLIGRPRQLGAHAIGLIVAIAIAAPWHLAMWNHYGDAFWQAYLGGQVLDRVTSDAHGSAPAWYYPLELAKSYWPWLASAGLAVAWGFRHRRSPVPRELGLLIALWCGMWLIVPTLAADKASRYIVSVYPLLAALSGAFFALQGPRVVARALTTASLWGAAVVPLVGIALLALNVTVHGPPSRHWTALLEAFREHPDVPVVVTQHSVSLEGTIYLDRRAWPALTDEEPRPPGTITVDVTSPTRPRDELLDALPSSAQIILDSPPFVVWRSAREPGA